jgi:hypothetical protein
LPLLHLNTHLDHKSGLARREGSKLILERTAELWDRRGEGPAIAVTYLAAGNEDTEDANTFHAPGCRFWSST